MVLLAATGLVCRWPRHGLLLLTAKVTKTRRLKLFLRRARELGLAERWCIPLLLPKLLMRHFWVGAVLGGVVSGVCVLSFWVVVGDFWVWQLYW